jgi:hypothetical protein
MLVINHVVAHAESFTTKHVPDRERETLHTEMVGRVIDRVRTFAPEHAAALDSARAVVLAAMNDVRDGELTKAVFALNKALGHAPSSPKSARQTYLAWIENRRRRTKPPMTEE